MEHLKNAIKRVEEADSGSTALQNVLETFSGSQFDTVEFVGKYGIARVRFSDTEAEKISAALVEIHAERLAAIKPLKEKLNTLSSLFEGSGERE